MYDGNLYEGDWNLEGKKEGFGIFVYNNKYCTGCGEKIESEFCTKCGKRNE